MQALPTLVAYPASRAFSNGGPGLLVTQHGRLVEPSPEERERALGYVTGATAAPGVSALLRHIITGRSMDANVMQSLFAVSSALTQWGAARACCIALQSTSPHSTVAVLAPVQSRYGVGCRILQSQGWQHGQPLGLSSGGLIEPLQPSVSALRRGQRPGLGHPQAPRAVSAFVASDSAVVQLGGDGDSSFQLHSSFVDRTLHNVFLCNLVLTSAAETADDVIAARDVWEDANTLHYLQQGEYLRGLAEVERRRVYRLSRQYAFREGQLLRLMKDGSTRVVTPPAERQALIQRVHEQCGHFGVKRTTHLLLTTNWWRGITHDVRKVLSHCKLCDRVRTAFNAQPVNLSPLSIEGMFYRWGVDLCGPFQVTARGSAYIMVCVEYYTKWVELIPIPSKAAASTAYAFAHNVLGRFGACAEVVTDQGHEWLAEFHDLLEHSFIDHRFTAPEKPSSNGLAERVVQTIKRALRKHCEQRRDAVTWDLGLPWVALAYRCSPQASTKFSPYYMLYARQPTIPPAVRARLTEPVDFDNSEAAAADVLKRAALVREASVIAGDNLRIAQHRDMLWYARRRDGSYAPRLRRFMPGDLVYVKRSGEGGDSLRIQARPDILMVKEVRDNGAVTLMGKCGRTVTNNISNLAPCHLPDIDTTVNPELAMPPEDLPCEVCRSDADAGAMLICDACGTGWHMYCLVPPLDEVPDGDWVCPRCLAEGVTLDEVKRRQRALTDGVVRELQEQWVQEKAMRTAFPTAATRRRDQRAEELGGRLIRKELEVEGVRRGRSKGRTEVWGLVYYRGAEFRPEYFEVRWSDGRKEVMSYARLSKLVLVPPGTRLPRGVKIDGYV
ncbi:MAG: hypothetical protein EOM68_17970 [Spirochaetia bacterium]|nr:hypothetical protein [Spirochaetia bacterium]